MAQSPEYVFDNSAPETRGRFAALESLFDPLTTRHLDGVTKPGARCLEVGGGSGSIANWMAARVGPAGRVVVTDIDTSHLPPSNLPAFEVRQHDVVRDPLEESAFDVIHTRLVLVHLPERLQVLERLVRALAPGGWLVVQEFDSLSMQPDPMAHSSETLLPTLAAMWDLMQSRGVHLRFGRDLFPELLRLGLVDVRAEGQSEMFCGGSRGAQLLRANFEQLHDAVVTSGRVTEEQFQRDLARLSDPEVVWPSQVLWTAQGRKP